MMILNEINSNNPYSPQFCGLNNIIKKRPYYNKHAYLDMLPDVFVREDGKVGSLPSDIIKLLGSKPAEKIKVVQDSLNTVNTEILSALEVQKLELIENISPKSFITPFLPKLAKIDVQPERIPRIFQQMRKNIMPSDEYVQKLTGKASEYLESRFKEIGLIKSDESVKVSYVGQGKFKNIFKLQLLDKEGKDVIHPKTIASFKEKDVAQKQFEQLIMLVKKYCNSVSEKQYSKIIDNLISHASNKVIPENQRGLYRDVLMQMYKDMKSGIGEAKFKDNLKKTVLREIEFNGIGPESNVTQFIKHASGSPLIKSDFVPFYYMNLKSNVALSEFSDELLPAPTHKVVLSKYGSYHDDLDMNKDNMVLGRVVDYGNIKPLPGFEILCDNPIVRRFNHKFSQIKFKDEKRTFAERIKYWNDLFIKVKSHKIPNHDDMLKALKLMKRQIPIELRYKLNDSGSDVFITQVSDILTK